MAIDHWGTDNPYKHIVLRGWAVSECASRGLVAPAKGKAATRGAEQLLEELARVLIST